MNRRVAARALLVWLPVAAATAVLAVLSYGNTQQALRQSADQPQVQLAQDAARQLDAGTDPATVVPATQVDVARSLAPFLIVYDSKGGVVASSGRLDGAVPPLPDGVLDAAKATPGRGDRITWQPADNVRIAAVVIPYGRGAVLAGRSLSEVEVEENRAFLLAFGACAVALAASAAAALLASAIYEQATGKG